MTTLLQTAFEDANIGMAFVGVDGKWLRTNGSLSELLGYSQEELLTLTFQEITTPLDWEREHVAAQRLFSGEIDHYRGAHRFWHKDGCSIRVALNASFVRNNDEHPPCFFVQLQELTDRMEVDRKRRSIGEHPTLVDGAAPDRTESTEPDLNFEGTLREAGLSIADLDPSQKEIAKLREGLLTVCAWTKRIRYEGRWMAMDEFLKDHLHLNLTHGISEEAVAGMMKDIEKDPGA